MKLSTLAAKISAEEAASPVTAYAWAWRILNEYPPELRAAALAWAAGEAPAEVRAGPFSLADALTLSGASVPAALEALYVLGRDPEAGKEMLFRSAPRDRRP